MYGPIQRVLARFATRMEWHFAGKHDPSRFFHSTHYLRHNARRLEHLASLRIPVAGSTVLEVGAGTGDHTHYYLDRGCRVTVTEARAENLSYLRQRYPGSEVRFLDMESPKAIGGEPFDVVHCYGLLYHLKSPAEALAYLATATGRFLFLETCVSFGDGLEVNNVPERRDDFTQAVSGFGCRPTRRWVFSTLEEHFDHVYMPVTQPNHEEFPLDWTRPDIHKAPLQRAVFIASRVPIDHELLSADLPMHQRRHE